MSKHSYVQILVRSVCTYLQILSVTIWVNPSISYTWVFIIPLASNRYQVALGSTPGGTQVHPFEGISPRALSALILNVHLSCQRRVFATVKGYNAAGFTSTATSNGIYLSRISADLEPLGTSYVYDAVTSTQTSKWCISTEIMSCCDYYFRFSIRAISIILPIEHFTYWGTNNTTFQSNQI